jgi:hypothetical protein
MTEFASVRIDVRTGEGLPLTGTDPYSLPWVQGAASTVRREIRERYSNQLADLREKLDVLRAKRRAKRDNFAPLYGPRPRSEWFKMMQNDAPPVEGRW